MMTADKTKIIEATNVISMKWAGNSGTVGDGEASFSTTNPSVKINVLLLYAFSVQLPSVVALVTSNTTRYPDSVNTELP